MGTLIWNKEFFKNLNILYIAENNFSASIGMPFHQIHILDFL